jgi:signal transduction histidine kinase
VVFVVSKNPIETNQMPDLLDTIQSASRARDELLASLSHELRLPLTTIKGYATALLLEEVEWSPEKRHEFLHMIEKECDHMEVMITEILDSSLIEVNRLKLMLQPLRLPQIAREIAAEMQHRTEIHNLIVDFPPEFPILEADPRWIRQVFRNILDNAIKYSPDGELIVIRGESRPANVVVSISDQGIGISPEDLISIFERYYRARSPVVSSVPGTGLGLPIARAIVEAHGGRIWAESKLGQGSTLRFSLPISR